MPENQTIVLTTIFQPSMPFFSTMSATYTEAFRRMGYGFKLISQPGERAMIDANLGIVDGEAGRINSLDRKKYANLIMVPYPKVTMQDGAYATDHSIKISGWESLVASAFAGYRALSQNYTDGSGDDKFKWDVTLYGPVLGLAITF